MNVVDGIVIGWNAPTVTSSELVRWVQVIGVAIGVSAENNMEQW